MWKNTRTNYGSVAKSLHWIMALLVITAWCVGYFADDFASKSTIGMWFAFHKSVGMIILMLLIIRVAWRVYDKVPRPSTTNKAIIVAAHTVHYLLYVFLLVQTLSGWLMSSAAGRPPTFFGLFVFPNLISKNKYIVPEFVAIHNTSALILLTLFILHVAGALFHHFILKDNTLRKMTVD